MKHPDLEPLLEPGRAADPGVLRDIQEHLEAGCPDCEAILARAAREAPDGGDALPEGPIRRAKALLEEVKAFSVEAVVRARNALPSPDAGLEPAFRADPYAAPAGAAGLRVFRAGPVEVRLLIQPPFGREGALMTGQVLGAEGEATGPWKADLLRLGGELRKGTTTPHGEFYFEDLEQGDYVLLLGTDEGPVILRDLRIESGTSTVL